MERIILSGSPRKNGKCAAISMAIQARLETLFPQDKARVILLPEIDGISGCTSCDFCAPNGGDCYIPDKMQGLYKDLAAADCLIIVSPVYFSGPPAQLKAIYDRFQAYFWTHDKQTPKSPAILFAVGDGLGGDPHGFEPLVTITRSALAVAKFRLERSFACIGIPKDAAVSCVSRVDREHFQETGTASSQVDYTIFCEELKGQEMAKLSYLASATKTKEILNSHGLSTKYSLGQNFLINDGIVQKICRLAALEQDDSILEIGPGIGTLSCALLSCSNTLVAIEKDSGLLCVHHDTLADFNRRYAVINKDALDISVEDIAGAVQKIGEKTPAKMPNKLVANLPYAVAATVVLDYFEKFEFIESATVMVQKEVADRMSAALGTKNYGSYSIKLSLYATPAGRFAVGPGNFFPPPRVESSVILLKRANASALIYQAGLENCGFSDAELIGAACTMANAAFATRRKTILNSCKTYFSEKGSSSQKISADDVINIIQNANVKPSVRGEALATVDFLRLGHSLLCLN